MRLAAYYSLSSLLAGSVVSAVPLLSDATNSGSAVGFAADPSIKVADIYAAAQAANKVKLASYPTSDDQKHMADIYGDWQNLTGVSAFHFIADMDTDCDGPKSNCKGNKDGQSLTSFGALDATQVPFFVIPEKFTMEHKDILKDNALGAVICDGKMFYGIYGDQNGDEPQVIGEASIVMGQACFPDAKIDGGSGHTELDVAYIVFGSQVPKGIERSSIDIEELKRLGDAQVGLLQMALGL
ncbi:fungal chitosanase of glycosyl hydrolase group 75-domain-containing protein [Mycena rebaudengoi]|nr:fungal chitosanase of glycosyl hydrolase group 75-domain-containing protein [Mycena rebaudengoi]